MPTIYGPYIRKDKRQHVIILYNDGRRRTVSYPRYLMEKKLGRKLRKGEEVDYIDEDLTNNKFSNFQILTKRANMEKSIEAGNMNSKGLVAHSKLAETRLLNSERLQGEKNINAVFTDSEVVSLRNNFTKKQVSIETICSDYNVGRNQF